jgi:hypothetical protein
MFEKLPKESGREDCLIMLRSMLSYVEDSIKSMELQQAALRHAIEALTGDGLDGIDQDDGK